MLDLQRFDVGDDYRFGGRNDIVINQDARKLLESEGYLIKRIAYGENKSNCALASMAKRHQLAHVGEEFLAHYAVFHYYATPDCEFAAFREWNSSRPYTVSVIVKDLAAFKKLKTEIKEDLTK